MQRFLLIDDMRNWAWREVGLDLEIDLKKTFVEDAKNEYDEIVYSHPDFELVIARTFADAIEKVNEGNWDRIYLDHDLGEYGQRTGYEVICHIEENPELAPKWFKCVSANPVGVDKIMNTWRAIQNRKNNENI